MFLLIAITEDLSGQWMIKKLPVLERRQYSISEWHEKLGVYLTQQFKQVWLASCSIPVRLIHIFEIVVEHVSARQMAKWMKRWSKLCHIHWQKVHDLKRVYNFKHLYSKQDDLVKQAIELWDASIEMALEGKQLHLYEFQKSIAFQNVTLSLKQVMDYLFVWCWFDVIGVCAGIKRRKESLFSWHSIYKYECRRCTNNAIRKEQTTCYSCGSDCMYCDECVQLGKVKSCSLLLYKNKESKLHSTKSISIEQIMSPYHLSVAQTDAVQHILNAIVQHHSNIARFYKRGLSKKGNKLSYLIWAVTGAGKTEMIYPLVHYFLLMNKKVLIAIPRRDVVQELHPRVTKAFPEHKIVSLYGGSKQIWESGDIYIATTHQLLRYSTYFDLVILDEMDAFPYYNNKMLTRTLKRVQKQHACYIQLTATVPRKEKLQLLLGQQRYVKVPVRFHRYPLPVPKFIKVPALLSILNTKQIPHALKSIVQHSSQRGAVLFIFLQRKLYLSPFSNLLEKSFPHLNISFTSAEDDKREHKVQQFRERHIDVLVTTSILERGVTIKKSDICIIDVHQQAFNRTAIVQMAGRAGRSIEDPNGFVYLLGVEKTNETKTAINEIIAMNKLASKRGYLRSE